MTTLKSRNGKKATTLTVGYVRVSSEIQVKNGGGLDRQEGSIREYCQSQGLILDHLYSEEGVSGTKEDRAALSAMIADLKKSQG